MPAWVTRQPPSAPSREQGADAKVAIWLNPASAPKPPPTMHCCINCCACDEDRFVPSSQIFWERVVPPPLTICEIVHDAVPGGASEPDPQPLAESANAMAGTSTRP